MPCHHNVLRLHHTRTQEMSIVIGTSRNDDKVPKKLRGLEALSRLSMMQTKIGLCEP